jgi:predicted XRE-type DNA-binding protein
MQKFSTHSETSNLTQRNTNYSDLEVNQSRISKLAEKSKIILQI